VFLLFGLHGAAVLFLVRWAPLPNQAKVWRKVMTPQVDDIKLIVACLAWPPSCFVSDATDRTGEDPHVVRSSKSKSDM
jgi:hypothetical protein